MSRHIKHKFTNEFNTFLEYEKETDPTISKRSSINIPDYSAVTENQNNRFQTDTNQISWLEKFAEDNQKICNSGLFEQNNVKLSTPQVTNQMKFSFNMNYNSDEKWKQPQNFTQKYHQNYNQIQSSYSKHNNTKMSMKNEDKKNILSDIQNRQEESKNKSRKDSIAGSIKKNQRFKSTYGQVTQYQRQIAQVTPLAKLQQMNDKLNKVLVKDPKPIETVIGKQNLKNESIFKYNSSNNTKSSFTASRLEKFEDNSKYFERISQKHFGKQQSIPKQKQYQNNNAPTLPSYISNSLSVLFNRLDRSQTGQLSKSNCSTELIPQELKFILGSIFTKIKLKQAILNKVQFIKQCQIAIKEVDLIELKALFGKLQVKKVDTFCEERSNKNIFNLQKKKILKQEEFYNNNKDLYQKQKNDYDYKQVKKSYLSVQSGKHLEKIGLSMNKYPDSNSKNSKLNSHVFPDFDKKSDKRSSAYDQTLFTKFDIKKEKYEGLGSTHKSKSSGLSELAIEQHRKSIDNLNKLNQRIQSCLGSKLFNDKASYNQEKRLKFDELIKHV